MQYKDFVREQMAKMPKDMMAKEKMKAIGKLWRESGHSKSSAMKPSSATKPKSVKGGQIVGAGVKEMKPKKSMKPKRVISMADHKKMIEAIPINIAAQLLKGL